MEYLDSQPMTPDKAYQHVARLVDRLETGVMTKGEVEVSLCDVLLELTDFAATKRLPGDLKKGDWFYSPRPEEGRVQVVCEHGKCEHDPSRTEAIHVFCYGWNTEFFVTVPGSWAVFVATNAHSNPYEVVDQARAEADK